MLRFVGDGDQKKFTKNPRHFSMQSSQANTKNIHKMFVGEGKVKKVANYILVDPENLLRLFSTLRVIFYLQGYFQRPSKNIL